MSTEPTAARGIRLPVSLWETIDREAETLQMRPTEFIRRKLQGCFSAPATVQNSHNTGQDAHEAEGFWNDPDND